MPVQSLFVPHLHAVLPQVRASSVAIPTRAPVVSYGALPQVMRPDLLAVGCALVQASSRADFRLGFNSSGAHSSVNHFHLQGWYCQELWQRDVLPVEELDRVEEPPPDDGSASPLCRLFRLRDHPVTSCMFSPLPPVRAGDPPSMSGVVAAAGAFLKRLCADNVAHQVVFLPGHSVLVFPRRLQADLNAGRINMALAELVDIGLWWVIACC